MANLIVTFKGIQLAVPSDDGQQLTVLAPNGLSPKFSSVGYRPLKDHRPILEFYEDDFDPDQVQGDLPRSLLIMKDRPRRLVFLDGHQIEFLSAKEELLEGGLTIGGSYHSNLPQMSAANPDAGTLRPECLNNGVDCLIQTVLRKGRVEAVRPSDVEWGFRRQDIYEPPSTPQQYSLDLRVTMELPEGGVAIKGRRIAETPAPPQDFTALLNPPANADQEPQDLRLWVKNRELDLVLFELDRDDEHVPGPMLPHEVLVEIDWDFEIYYSLYRNTAHIRVPHYVPPTGAGNDGGAGCGTIGSG